MKYAAIVLTVFGAWRAEALAQQLVAPFADEYLVTDLGAPIGLPIPFGGVTLLPDDPNTLLITGASETADTQLFTVGVQRSADNHIIGFTGSVEYFADAPYSSGGLSFGPSGVLFSSRWPTNEFAQLLPGSTSPDKVIDMLALGIADAHAAHTFVPAGQPGAGSLKLLSWEEGEFYDAQIQPDGMGTFDITSITQTSQLQGGPLGFAYVPAGSAEFPQPSMIVSEWSDGNIAAYEVDADGNPIASTRRLFIEGLDGADGALIDPLTGDFLFSTFGAENENRVIAVRGFVASVPEPSSGLYLLLITLGTACYRYRGPFVHRWSE